MHKRHLIATLLLCLGFALPWQQHSARAQATLLPSALQCFSALAPTSGGPLNTGTGFIGLLGTITAGTGGTSGTYGGVTLTGSLSGQSNATANITVSGGGVTAVAILNPGNQYVVGDVLTATSSAIGNVSGFSVPVSSIAINTSLAGGTVGYYIPNTNTFKQTWQNSGQTILNTNPVNLDANGCAIVYGSGIYRQVLKDSLGNTVWDQITASTNQNNPYWAAQAGGTANVITVTDTAFAGVDGSIVNFIPLLTNTGPTTINASGYGAIPVVKDTSAGAVALTGGEIVASGTPNVVSVIYSATQNDFHILNNIIQGGSATSVPQCGATGLKIANGSSSSTTTITARQVVMQSTAGAIINRSSVSVTLNITLGTAGTPVAGGMDGEATGTSAWLDVFAIDNGTAPAGLGSVAAVNGQNPAFPTGYSYKCYLGAIRVNSGGNLLGTLQLGNVAQYVVGGANLTALPIIVTGASGDVTVPTWTPEAVTSYVPPTATTIKLSLNGIIAAVSANRGAMVAPNNSYGAFTSTTNPPPLVNAIESGNSGTNVLCCGSIPGEFALESTNIYYAATSAAYVLTALGWKDSVNAN